MAFAAGLAWAAAITVRPNLALGGGLALCALMSYFVAIRALASIAAAVLGFSLVGFSLAHNLYFGGEPVPFVYVDPQNVGNSPINFIWAAEEILTLNFKGRGLASTIKQLERWSEPHGLFALIFIGALGLSIFEWKRIWRDVRLRILAAAAFGLQATLWVYRPGGRYGHAAWTLTVFLAILVADARWNASMRLARLLRGKVPTLRRKPLWPRGAQGRS